MDNFADVTVRPDTIKIAVLLLIVNITFAAVLFTGQNADLIEPFGQWSAPMLALIMGSVWFFLAWSIFKRRLWAKFLVSLLLLFSMALTLLDMISNPSIVTPLELLQTASDLVVFILLESPSAQKWLKADD